MGKFTDYSLPLKSLPKGEHNFTFKLGKQFFVDMESTDIRDACLTADVTVRYANDIYDLDLHVSGEITLLCDRCLDEMSWPIDASYQVMVKYGEVYRDDNDKMLEIPSSVNDLNVAYMLYDTVSLAIPIKHVHPLGKCNRQMSAMLRKHRVRSNDPDAELEDELIDGIDDAGAGDEDAAGVDPRWNALKGLSTDED